MKILVTGGKGYIGAITAKELVNQGHKVVIYDKKNNQKIQDGELLEKTLKDEKIEAVMHFAAYIEMGESMENPYKYFENNVFGSLNLLEAMRKTKVNKLIFSSTAGVYGNPIRVPIKEDDQKKPENPYGESKLMVERLLKWYDKIHDLKSISLRYFNAAGATLDGTLGENHEPESHLIPNVIKAVIKRQEFKLFGDDYPTADGTCIRDYIHVLDLAEAHILGLKALNQGHKTDVFNVGTGIGYSNKQVIEMVKKVIKIDLMVKVKPRRIGDANELVADSGKLQNTLGWKPEYSDLKTIIESAYKWHSKSGQF
ncbi:MAG: UDP-glucose 4-epimerase GalE [Candidatus Beckwithbacteria bacterium]|nr:UDP-glucose 4-epimerase GalE [Patescibacteria group bacterium]